MSLSGHVTHIRDVAGEDHVGIGAGYDGINRYDFRSHFNEVCNQFSFGVIKQFEGQSDIIFPVCPCHT
jgi:microsomal dipeptidase-like Zn-dependent dipeptidase